MVAMYQPVSLFSLRMAHATSKGGKTLLAPTPYAVKMALIDACFRLFEAPEALAHARMTFDLVKARPIRIQPPKHCVVQNTFIKILDEARDSDQEFKQTIAYREFAAYQCGSPEDGMRIAMGAGALTDREAGLLAKLWMHILSFGKRGSFFQFVGCQTLGSLPPGYTAPFTGLIDIQQSSCSVIQYLDDFGEALCTARDGFDRISTFGDGNMRLGEHRVLVPTLVPYSRRSSSRSFTWYERIG